MVVDLHGLSHVVAERKIINAIENPDDEMMIRFIVGNSIKMKSLVEDIVNEYGYNYGGIFDTEVVVWIK